MSDSDNIGARMKEYEMRNRYYLQKKIPVICRLDMRAGHTFCRGLDRPFDKIFMKTIQETAKYLCENVQGCKVSYQQSDEITLLLTDYDTISTDCFFDYRVDKLCSILASIATMAFNRLFIENTAAMAQGNPLYETKFHTAMFDCRCFNLPKEEVVNNFYWRQLEAIRNSIQMIGQANFRHKELQNKTCEDIRGMLLSQKKIDWECDFSTAEQRGSCCVRKEELKETVIQIRNEAPKTVTAMRSSWIVDTEIPIFKSEGRSYIEQFVYPDVH